MDSAKTREWTRRNTPVLVHKTFEDPSIRSRCCSLFSKRNWEGRNYTESKLKRCTGPGLDSVLVFLPRDTNRVGVKVFRCKVFRYHTPHPLPDVVAESRSVRLSLGPVLSRNLIAVSFRFLATPGVRQDSQYSGSVPRRSRILSCDGGDDSFWVIVFFFFQSSWFVTQVSV